MTATTSERGHTIAYIDGKWEEAPAHCAHCGRTPTTCQTCGATDHDPCLGHVEGASAACCGHGDPKRAYVR